MASWLEEQPACSKDTGQVTGTEAEGRFTFFCYQTDSEDETQPAQKENRVRWIARIAEVSYGYVLPSDEGGREKSMKNLRDIFQ